jgi:hypothetical protein
MSRFVRIRRAVLALVLASVGPACNTKSGEQLYNEAEPAANALRAKTIAAAQLAQKQPPAAGAKCKTTKKLTYDPTSDAHDTDFMMFELAKRGGTLAQNADTEDDIDFPFSNNPFDALIGCTSDRPPILGSPCRSKVAADSIRRAKNVKNLILVRSHAATVDYFLVDLPAGTIACSGTFDAYADPSLGTRASDYDIVTKNKKTGKEVKRETHHDVHDDRKAALYNDARKKFAAHMKAELGLTVD